MRPFAAVFAAALTLSIASEPRAEEDRALLVLAAPLAGDSYYAPVYDAVLAFQRAYAEAALPHDDVVILTDKAGWSYFTETLPESVLIEAPMLDIWARDYSPVAPRGPVHFRYAAVAQGGSQSDADAVQDAFAKTVAEFGIEPPTTGLILDGGNFVGDGAGKAIVTDRFLDDNDLSETEGIAALKDVVGLDAVAIIPTDDPEGLAHADGMVMFADPNTIFMNAYDEPFRTDIRAILIDAFPGVRVLDMPVVWHDQPYDAHYGTSCGIYVNAVVTDNAIYVPQFGLPGDAKAVALLRSQTNKTVVPIESTGVCDMGGSARCTVWHAEGDFAAALRDAASD